MDVLELFEKVAELIIYYWSIPLTIGGHVVTVGSAILFSILACLIINFIRGLAD